MKKGKGLSFKGKVIIGIDKTCLLSFGFFFCLLSFKIVSPSKCTVGYSIFIIPYNSSDLVKSIQYAS